MFDPLGPPPSSADRPAWRATQGTRDTQNFELLKIVGRQLEFPVLFIRGFGITLDESLNAAEYLASVGTRNRAPDGILEIFHATMQGVIAGANMILVDFHPAPTKALVDGPQALLMEELPLFLECVRNAREAYEKNVRLAGEAKRS